MTDNQRRAVEVIPNAMRLYYPDVIDGVAAALDEAEARGRAEAVAKAVQAVEALRPHIPPSADPDRRSRVIQRSSFNRAASAVRALVAEKDVP